MNENYCEYNGKVLLITGGTGSFGHAVLKHNLEKNFEEIRIFFSR